MQALWDLVTTCNIQDCFTKIHLGESTLSSPTMPLGIWTRLASDVAKAKSHGGIDGNWLSCKWNVAAMAHSLLSLDHCRSWPALPNSRISTSNFTRCRERKMIWRDRQKIIPLPRVNRTHVCVSLKRMDCRKGVALAVCGTPQSLLQGVGSSDREDEVVCTCVTSKTTYITVCVFIYT
mmetsp:Transcript_26598/g.61898  ORF Transcript_26598/g.61898 Transcript_26598/m.61898 type:complete len:178 (+) Transcript_26598:210-743(+)